MAKIEGLLPKWAYLITHGNYQEDWDLVAVFLTQEEADRFLADHHDEYAEYLDWHQVPLNDWFI